MKDVKEFLSKISDDELFQIINHTGEEVKKRIIKLLKEHYCLSVEFSLDDDVELSVNDIFGSHKFPEDVYDKWVNIKEIGFTNVYVNGTVFKDYLYCYTDNDEVFQGEEINEYSLWDVYKDLKENFLKYEKDRKQRTT